MRVAVANNEVIMVQKTKQKNNRRGTVRIYEQANLFYRRLEPPSADVLGFSALSESDSQENDTLNVNISRSGLAFTCREPLVPGELLFVRLLLLSRMTTISTVCRVIYCQPSNPYETDRYPYQVGVEFINLRPEEARLLDDYVRRKKRRQQTLAVCLIAMIIVVLNNPELILDFMLDMMGMLLDYSIELLSTMRDGLGYALTHVLERSFKMDHKALEIFAFYLQTGIELALSLVFLMFLWFFIRQTCWNIRRFISRKRASMVYYWQQQSGMAKFRLIGVALVTISVYVGFMM